LVWASNFGSERRKRGDALRSGPTGGLGSKSFKIVLTWFKKVDGMPLRRTINDKQPLADGRRKGFKPEKGGISKADGCFHQKTVPCGRRKKEETSVREGTLGVDVLAGSAYLVRGRKLLKGEKSDIISWRLAYDEGTVNFGDAKPGVHNFMPRHG